MRCKIVFIAVIISFFLINCARNNNGDSAAARDYPAAEKAVEIMERMFVTQINEIYMNAEDYLGRTIKLEGIFIIEQLEDDTVFFVLRQTPDGCCGTRGFAGFEVKAAANQPEHFPANDSWVEAIGVLREYRMGLTKYLYLELSSLNILNRRGAEFVTR